jgi:anti-sigma factor RsiW
VHDASADVISARRHVQECVECRQFFDEWKLLHSRLKEIAVREAAPLEVRQRLFAAIAEARTNDRRNSRRLWMVAGGIAAVALLASPLFLRRVHQQPLESFAAAVAADHGQWLHGGEITTGAESEVSRWIATKVPYAVDVPVFPGGRLIGGRIARIDGRQAAVMLYDIDGQPMSYFVVQRDGTRRAERTQRLIHATAEGYQLVMWDEPGLLHVLVSRAPTAVLDQLALMCIEKARRESKA